MNIFFKQIIPHPLKETINPKSDIWNTNCEFNFGKSYIINATSGKGKTTFTHLLCGLRNDFSGTLEINGKDAKCFTYQDWSDWRFPKASFVFQDLQLFPQLSVEENIKLHLKLGTNVSLEKAKSWLAFLGIGEKWQQKCGTLSMGQQQRLAIVRALLPSYKWLILDEPFSHLDKENTLKAMQLIQERTNENKAGFIFLALDPQPEFQANFHLQL